jgi:flavin reductase (DIM6/NTAB) family NADH-FMN oxidoreductase RutF
MGTRIAGLDHRALRTAFAAFPTGVTAVCALAEGRPVGIAASSFTSLSLDPPLVSVAFGHQSRTWSRLRGGARRRGAERIGVSVLAAEHAEFCRVLADPSADRFAGVDWTADARGAVHIGGSPLWLTCSLESVVATGDHDLAVLFVHEARGELDTEPLVFHGSRFRRIAG